MRYDTVDQPEEPSTIKQKAAQCGLSAYTLRYYEMVGQIKPLACDRRSGHRRYNAETAEVVEALPYLRASGLSLEAMRTYLRQRERGERCRDEMSRRD